MKGLLDFMPADIGRAVSDFAQRFLGGNLAEDAKEVLERLVPRMSEVAGASDRTYIRNVLPYRTEDNRIDGVVTFTEITERKHWKQEVQAAREFAESIVATVRAPLLVLTPDLRGARPTHPSIEPIRRAPRRRSIGRSTSCATGSGTSRSCAGFWTRFCLPTSSSMSSRSSTSSRRSGGVPCC
jgi:hypothetical protein